MSRRGAVLALGVLVLVVAAPLAEYLNRLAWSEFWRSSNRNAMYPWWTPQFYRQGSADGALADGGVRVELFVFLQYGLPSLLFAAAMLLRVRPVFALIVGLLTPFVLTAAGLLLLGYRPPYEGFVQAVILSMIASALAFIFLSIVARKPLDDDEVVLEAGGVRRHPWRAWIILAAGFLALQAAVALADYLDSMLWEMLEILVGVGRWSTREPVVHDSLGDFNMAGLHYAVKNIVFTVLPFLLFALAVVLRMRPWCGWILGAFLAIALGLEMWGFESGSWYALASRALLFGECCAVPGVLLLWLYHAKVSKLRAVIDDDFV